MEFSSIAVLVALLAMLSNTLAFQPQLPRRTFYHTLKAVDKQEKDKPKFSIGALIQLVTMGAGAPSLGEYKRTDETGRMFFELEANNLVDSEGVSIQTKAKYFKDGYVGKDFDDDPPGFWANLASGGKLQAEWDERQIAARKSKGSK